MNKVLTDLKIKWIASEALQVLGSRHEVLKICIEAIYPERDRSYIFMRRTNAYH